MCKCLTVGSEARTLGQGMARVSCIPDLTDTEAKWPALAQPHCMSRSDSLAKAWTCPWKGSWTPWRLKGQDPGGHSGGVRSKEGYDEAMHGMGY